MVLGVEECPGIVHTSNSVVVDMYNDGGCMHSALSATPSISATLFFRLLPMLVRVGL